MNKILLKLDRKVQIIEGSGLDTVNCKRNVIILEGKVPVKGSKIEH